MPSPEDALSFGQLVAEGTDLVEKITIAVDGYYAWSVGTVSGGPNGDGRYPLPVAGAPGSVLVPCPAKIAASGSTPLTAAAISALPAATVASGAEPYPAVDSNGVLRKYTANLFAARRTADLVDLSRMTGNEILPALTEAGGLERRIAVREMHRIFTGVINPKLPPYNCKGDFQIAKNATTWQGWDVVTNSEPMFRASDVGKLVYVSNNYFYDAPVRSYQSTIVEYMSPTQVRCADAFPSSVNYAELAWGTDDTAGMQAAINACRAPGTYTYGGCVMLPPGMYLCGPMSYPARMAIKGYGRRQCMLVRKPNPPTITYDTHQFINEDAMCDFNIFSDWGLHGLRYQQNKGGIGFGFYSVDSSQVTPQNDPYPYWSGMLITEQTYHGIETYNRHSGDIIAMEIVGCFGIGFNCHSYDINMVNMLTIGNWGPGLNLESGGCNINNLKSSFNGVNGYFLPADEGNCNLLVKGSGNNITNARLQESVGCSLVVTGYFNKFGDMSLEDAGCIYFEHGGGTPPALRAALYFKGGACTGNILNDVSYGRAVHEFGDHMTHAIYFSENPTNNKGRMWERPGSDYDVAKTGHNNNSGVIDATNKITIDGVSIV